MRAGRLLGLVVLVGSCWIAGCSGKGSFGGSSPPPAGSEPVNLVFTDTAPAGVTVLSFKLTITGAELDPGKVSLVSNTAPILLEITRLQTEDAFLTNTQVANGTYNTLTLTFANADLTFKNDTGATITAGGVNCPNGTVCEIKPTTVVSTATVTPTSPVVVSPSSPTGLLVDIHLNTVISSTLGLDFSTPGGVTLSQLPSVAPPAPMDELDDVIGQVTSRDFSMNQITLQTSLGPLIINVDPVNTTFVDFGSVCSSNNLACINLNQIVEVDLNLRADGTLVAIGVELKDSDSSEEEVEGVIFAVDSTTQFRMVVLEEVPGVTGLDVGNTATVVLSGLTAFSIDNEGFSTPSGASFAGPGDLLVGQQVQVKRLSSSSGTTINADRVRLRVSRFTATVAPSASTPCPLFCATVTGLPKLFVSAGVTQIQVQTSAATQFSGVSGVRGLVTGDTVSLRGLLFRLAGANPVVVASKVRKR